MKDHSPPVSIPRLQTERLLLREYRENDFDAFAAHCADPKAMAHWGVIDRRNARRVFAANMGEWMLRGAGWWAVELRALGSLVGSVGAIFREGWPEIELGWNTFQAYWGQGIATEAAREVVRYAFDVRREGRVTALIDAPNTASIRVAAHVGMTYEGNTDFRPSWSTRGISLLCILSAARICSARRPSFSPFASATTFGFANSCSESGTLSR